MWKKKKKKERKKRVSKKRSKTKGYGRKEILHARM